MHTEFIRPEDLKTITFSKDDPVRVIVDETGKDLAALVPMAYYRKVQETIIQAEKAIEDSELARAVSKLFDGTVSVQPPDSGKPLP